MYALRFRKHKAIKRYANNLMTSTLSYEKSTLEDLLLSQLETLAHLLFQAVKLLSGQKEAPRALREGLGLQAGETFMSQMATIDGLRAYSNDVCSFELEGSEACGQVCCHVKINGAQMTCVSRWTEQSLSVFDMTVFVPTRSIKEVHPVSVKDERARVCR